MDVELLYLNLVRLCSGLQECIRLSIVSIWKGNLYFVTLTRTAYKYCAHQSSQKMPRRLWLCKLFCCLPGHLLRLQLYGYVTQLVVNHLACWGLDLLLANVNDEGFGWVEEEDKKVEGS